MTGRTSWQVAKRIIERFRSNPRATLIWSRQALDATFAPSVFVACSDGMYDLDGVVIGGQRDDDTGEGWDLSGMFILFDEHGAILAVNGWRATELITLRQRSNSRCSFSPIPGFRQSRITSCFELASPRPLIAVLPLVASGRRIS